MNVSKVVNFVGMGHINIVVEDIDVANLTV